ncbi:MAG: PD-(D/E)XK nuclease family protein [Pseudomonadota bacterium]
MNALHWGQVATRIDAFLREYDAHPSDVVVLVPYAQLMTEARQAWAGGRTAGFLPRFETTSNWATSLQAALGPVQYGPDDLRQDAAFDVLTAGRLLARVGLGSQKDALASRLMEAAWSLARLAAAVPPDDRQAWSVRVAQGLRDGLDEPVLALEAAIAQVAVTWAGMSTYPTDVLFSVEPALLVVLEGFQADPLGDALKARRAGRTLALSLVTQQESLPATLYQTADMEDEAAQAAACVLQRLAQGARSVALVAQDRVVTRRIRAMLGERGVRLRDETGWKLSTTRSGAALMSLLQAATWDASADAVLAWLKSAPNFSDAEVSAAEREIRRAEIRQWQAIPEQLAKAHALAERLGPVLQRLQRTLTLSDWLRELRAALKESGQWNELLRDTAGQACLDALGLQEGRETAFEHVIEKMDLRDFTVWFRQTLEAGSFTPEHPVDAQVIILPLTQLLGRSVDAVVLPGADEMRLPVSPEPPGVWTAAQRELLGLPSREALTTLARLAWDYALQSAPVDVLWRSSDAGEHVMASGFVQALQLQTGQGLATDCREVRELAGQPVPAPLPQGHELPVKKLSASAYEDLRRCPYRFFALRQLGLQEPAELDGELGKRDFGNWLHSLLRHFHESLQALAGPVDLAGRVALMDDAADRASRELALSETEFLPFLAAWPRVREGYLGWLTGHEAEGAVFAGAELEREAAFGALTLTGKIDRVDRLGDGQTLVIDYKTEARTTTQQRIAAPQEDTQLAFYAALLQDDELSAAYVNLGEKEPTRSYVQGDIVALRDGLIDSLLTDMAHIAEGAPLPALGAGKACDYCAARGLCRKDFR